MESQTSSSISNAYLTLGLSENSTRPALRKRWLRLLAENHPDRNGENFNERCQQINEAYNMVNNKISADGLSHCAGKIGAHPSVATLPLPRLPTGTSDPPSPSSEPENMSHTQPSMPTRMPSRYSNNEAGGGSALFSPAAISSPWSSGARPEIDSRRRSEYARSGAGGGPARFSTKKS